jgi:hypothetical protein
MGKDKLYYKGIRIKFRQKKQPLFPLVELCKWENMWLFGSEIKKAERVQRCS